MTLLHRLAGETSHWADDEKLPFAELLLDYGADLETRDDELQSTPLGHACRYGLAKLAALLLEHGASVEAAGGCAMDGPASLGRATRPRRNRRAFAKPLLTLSAPGGVTGL